MTQEPPYEGPEEAAKPECFARFDEELKVMEKWDRTKGHELRMIYREN